MHTDRPDTPPYRFLGVSSDMSYPQALAFYVGFPLIFGMLFGSNSGGSAMLSSKEAHILWALSVSFPVWWMQDIFSRLTAIVLRPWKPPFWFVLALGIIPALLLNGPLHIVRVDLFRDYFVEGGSIYPIWPWNFSDPTYLSKNFYNYVTGLLLWLPVNYFYLQVLGVTRYGYAEEKTHTLPWQSQQRHASKDQQGSDTLDVTSTASDAEILNPVYDRLPKDLGKEVIGLKAEEHYTRIFTTLGDNLMLIRFTDATKALKHLPGMQVHRSYWINRDYIKDVHRENASYQITMTTGWTVPVSRSFKIKVEEELLSKTDISSPQ